MKVACQQWVVQQWEDKNEDNNKINRNNPTNDCFLPVITSGEDNK